MTSTPATPADAVRHQIQGEILQITVDNPPVNALSAAVRRGLLAAIEAADAEPRVKAVLIVGQGANFIAGADIREFGQTPQPPSLPEVCNRIEACSRPVVA
ncbi:enoyl-CoA hydratase/isomerase family protein, partial [Pseudacidovorax intermedius]|uniref:enoyl-CoA hydratase/isomerase family protein n=1 Tax=Pseudacidovorax intermedius TaxID=433924 RepID=UPI0005BC7CBA